ncbi:MAG: nicotinate (nicotinamide) nucleotide adenylyltransferase, partial [Phycisphaeraceae bacterium]
MDLARCDKVIVFGGSFDPPHRAHVRLPRQVGEAIGADAVAYVPAARAPHKLDRTQTDATHRLAMLQAALADEPWAIVLTDELDRARDGRPSYTVDTLEALHRRLPDAELRLLMGADQVRIFDQWHEAARVAELAEPVVLVRPPESAASLLASLPAGEREVWAARLVEVDRIDVSSTQVRQRVG